MLAGSVQSDSPTTAPLLGGGGGGDGASGLEDSATTRSTSLEAAGGAVLFATRLRRRARRLQRALSQPSASLAEILPPMSAEDTLALSPWQKWRRFNRVPMKALLQLLLVALVSAQTYFYSSTVLPYFNQSTGSFASNFYGYTDASGIAHSAPAATSYGGSYSLDISTIPDFASSLESTLSSYERFVNESIDGYVTEPSVPTVRGVATCGPLPSHNQSTLLARNRSVGGGRVAALCGEFELTRAAPRGPFGSATQAEWRSFFDSLVTIQLEWVLVDVQVDFLDRELPPRLSTRSLSLNPSLQTSEWERSRFSGR